MTKPATDEEISDWADDMHGYDMWSDDCVLSLIARIQAETEARKAAEALAASIRHTTIHECAEYAHDHLAAYDPEHAERIYKTLVALLDPNP